MAYSFPAAMGRRSPRVAFDSIAPVDQAYAVLHTGFVVLPLIVGMDKFFGFIANWDSLLAPFVTQILPVSPHAFMQAAGVVEIGAAVLVAFQPEAGAWVVAAWLWAVVVNTVAVPGQADAAIRDFGLSLGAVALASLSRQREGNPSLGAVRSFPATA